MSASEIAEPVEVLLLERESRALVLEALALTSTCHLAGVRDRRRKLLEGGIERAEVFVAAAKAGHADAVRLTEALWMLVQAHAARAEDARYGAGQLAQGSQRAPTEEDCEDGWERVASIVLASEVSALEAVRIATELNEARAFRLAKLAEAAASQARRLVDERNRAYTFHTDPTFSFGEGWYLAAAATLAGVQVQLQLGRSQTEQAELFLREAGLGSKLVPYRPRPRANKALPAIVARAFRADPGLAQEKLRAAFLGGASVPEPIGAWVVAKLRPDATRKKVLLWVRTATHHPDRNTDPAELVALARTLLELGLTPVFIGDALPGDALGEIPVGAVDLTLFWKEPLFQSGNMRRAQLQLFEHLKQVHGLVGQIGVTTAGMDGPALMGLPTIYLTEEPNVRLGRWVGAVPRYEEVVRGPGYLERIIRTVQIWRDADHPENIDPNRSRS